MEIRCWGSRGSIPISGKKYLKYGGDTTCLEIITDSNDIIIVDAGTGIRRLGNHLIKKKCFNYNLIFTHAHWDHLMGFPFFSPIYTDKATLLMHRCPFHNRFVKHMLSGMLAPPNFPVKYSEVKANIRYETKIGQRFRIGSVDVIPIPLSHPNGGSGYKFVENGKSFIFLTDNELGFTHPGGLATQDYLNFCKGADLLFHDGEYTPEEYITKIEWGHSIYSDALELGLRAGVKRLGLFHLNQERTDKEMDSIVASCRELIKKRGSFLDCFAVGADMRFIV